MDTWIRDKGQEYFDEHKLAKQLIASNDDDAKRNRQPSNDDAGRSMDELEKFWRSKMHTSYKYALSQEMAEDMMVSDSSQSLPAMDSRDTSETRFADVDFPPHRRARPAGMIVKPPSPRETPPSPQETPP